MNKIELEVKIKQLQQKLANTHWDADCHVDSERGENTCQLEGTHICMLCRLADDRREIKRLKTIIDGALAWTYGPYSDKELLRRVITILKTVKEKE